MRTYTVIGAGALGSYYGARLAHAGRTVRFLVRSDFEHVRRHGLRVDSVEGDFSLPDPEVYDRAELLPPSDVALIGLKTTQNELLPALLPPAVREEGWVLNMQNGLGLESDTALAAPGRTVLGGLAFLCSNKIGPGHVRHLDYGSVRLAEWSEDGTPAGLTGAVQSIASDFRDAGIAVELEEDLATARWKKLVWNVPYNGLCALHRCRTDAIMADATLRARAERIMREVLAIADAGGHGISPAFVTQMLDFTTEMAPYDPSMKLDLERGQPLEIDALYARPLDEAHRLGVEAPEIEELHGSLLAL